jgi:DNA polymerase-1
MRIIVDHDNIEGVVHTLSSLDVATICIDVETTGLSHNDRLFSIQLALKDGDSYHFNFNDYGDISPLLSRNVISDLDPLWLNPNIRWIAHNIKFELRMLDYEGARLNGQLYDTMVAAHIMYNDHMSYSLDNCLKRIGLTKNDKVGLWIKDNKAYTRVDVPGKKLKDKLLHFDKVPYDIMLDYSMMDVEEMMKLYDYQIEYLTRDENNDQWLLVDSNMQLTRAVWNMEKEGIKVDLEYCKNALLKSQGKTLQITKEIEEIAGLPYKGGPIWLSKALSDQGIDVTLSSKGNAELGSSELEAMNNALASLVVMLRETEKEEGFYHTFIRYADNSSIIHPNFRVTGTATGRFSCSEPNIQQVPKDEKSTEEFTTRGAFHVDDDFILVSMDYDQMEYRVMADYAGEHGMIKAIKEGMDPHSYVGNMMGVDRKTAKTLNFGLLYGMGQQKLALALGVEVSKAKQLKDLYYRELPNVQALTREIMAVGVSRGYIKNKYGRRYYLQDPNFAYKLPNYLIQGTCADVVRHVIPKVDFLLEGTRSKLLLAIHDEAVIKVHRNEVHLIPEIKRIMQDEYAPINGMNLTCGTEWSDRAWKTTDFKKWEI